jgi:hypothetical protein
MSCTCSDCSQRTNSMLPASAPVSSTGHNVRTDLGSGGLIRLLEVTMKRVALPLVVAVGLLAVAPLAHASDASLKRALRAYKARLTTDIGYLASFAAPNKGAAVGALRRLSTVRGDLTGATHAATLQQASTSSGRRARTLVLSGLHDAIAAVGDARASATAARSGNRSAAKRAARKARDETNKAIPLFESGGRLLHLF